MSSNTENTEAKLAAYIDGQLDPAERAQIEQYLQANAEHRKLLADMIAQRDVLRSLPRDKAPADIYDAIQAQLERSVLLDDSAHAAAPTVRHGRRSSLFAIAAILLLAVGLGGVLYFALPSTRPNAIDVASTNQPTTLAVADAAAERAPAAGATLARKTRPAASAIAEAPSVSLTPGSVANSIPASPTAEALSGVAGDTRDLGKALAAGQSAPDAGQLVLLVSTDDPSKVNRQVETYLETNKIRWEAVNAPNDQVFYGRASGGAAFAGQQQKQQQTAAPDTAGKLATAVGGSQAQPQENQENRALADADAEAAKKSEVDKAATGTLEGAEAINKEKLADLSTQQAARRSDRLAAEPQSLPATQQQQQAARQYFYNIAKDSGTASPPQYIIARGMTRQQAVQLTDTLSADRPTQRARLIGQAHVPVAAKVERQDTTLTLSQTQATTAEAKPAVLPEDAGTGIVAQQRQQQQQPQQAEASATQAAPQGATTTPVEPAQAATLPTTQAEPAVDVVILVEDESPTAAPTTTTTTTAPATTAPTTQHAPEY